MWQESKIGLMGWIILYSSWYDYPWRIGGDFNVVLNREENIGGVPIQGDDVDDFKSFIKSSDLVKFPFTDNPFI